MTSNIIMLILWLPFIQPSNFSLDRFDAYGDYEYIDIDRHPNPIQFHKPLPHRPQTLHQHHEHIPVAQPIRRLDYQVR